MTYRIGFKSRVTGASAVSTTSYTLDQIRDRVIVANREDPEFHYYGVDETGGFIHFPSPDSQVPTAKFTPPVRDSIALTQSAP